MPNASFIGVPPNIFVQTASQTKYGAGVEDRQDVQLAEARVDAEAAEPGALVAAEHDRREDEAEHETRR